MTGNNERLWSVVVLAIPWGLWLVFAVCVFPVIALEVQRLGAGLPVISLWSWRLSRLLSDWPLILFLAFAAELAALRVVKPSIKRLALMCGATMLPLVLCEIALWIPFRMTGAFSGTN